MKKILFILLSLFLLTACSNSETPIQKQEISTAKDEIPQETIDGITQIVRDFETYGVETPCESCRCAIKTRNETPGGSVIYLFQCSSGNTYWASYCPVDGSVHVSEQFTSANGGSTTLINPSPTPCN